MLMIANKMLPLRNVLEALKANLSYFAVALALSGCMSGDFDSFIVGPEVAAEVRNTSQWANYAGAGSRRATKLEQINKDNIASVYSAQPWGIAMSSALMQTNRLHPFLCRG